MAVSIRLRKASKYKEASLDFQRPRDATEQERKHLGDNLLPEKLLELFHSLLERLSDLAQPPQTDASLTLTF